jgi:formylglycine-generating enzyme required for sulfatase activity
MKPGIDHWVEGLAVVATLAAVGACGVTAEAPGVGTVESPATRARVEDLRARFVVPTAESPEPTFVLPRAVHAPAALRPALGLGVATGFELRDGSVRAVMPAEARRAVLRTATVALPAHVGAPVQLEDDVSHLAITFTPHGTNAAAITMAGGVAMYAGALAGADVLYRVHAEGTEDYVVFEERPAEEEIAYDVDVSRVAGLRLVSNTLEFLDDGGAPRLRIAPPYVVDARGARTEGVIGIHGCAFDASPKAPWGRAVTAPGASRCAVRVSWNAAAYPAMVDPGWTTTGSMATGRACHTATLLASGRVLLVGGWGNGPRGASASYAELYDPTSGTFGATGSLATARWCHTATLLGSGSDAGQVLVAGGTIDATEVPHTATSAVYIYTATSSAELYDPVAGTFAVTGSMTAARQWHAATLLASGKVLVAGGGAEASVQPETGMSSAELYDPASRTFVTTGSMTAGRYGNSATLLASGKVLLAGGNNKPLSSAELYDPAVGSFAATGPMTTPRYRHTATLLGSGEVLVSGGATAALMDDPGNGTPTSSADLYDPATGAFGATGPMTTPRYWHTATLLGSGEVLIAGGDVTVPSPDGETVTTTASAEFYRPSSGNFVATRPMTVRRSLPTATLLGSGEVLVAGGSFLGSYRSAEILTVESADGGLDAATVSGRASTRSDGGNLAGAGVAGGCSCRTGQRPDAPSDPLRWLAALGVVGMRRLRHRRAPRIEPERGVPRASPGAKVMGERPVCTLLGVLLLVGCTSSGARATAGSSTDGGRGARPPEESGPPWDTPKDEFIPRPTGNCPTIADGTITFSPAGIPPRGVHVYMPRSVRKPAPLIFYWHGSDQPPEEAEFGLPIAAVNAAGWIVASPRHDPKSPTGAWLFPTGRDDDFVLADEVIGCVNEQIGVDTRHIHSIGMSNGGLQTTRMSWRRDGYLASSVSYSGGVSGSALPHLDAGESAGNLPPEQDPGNKFAVMMFHGGPTDWAQQNSQEWLAALKQTGHFAIICDHGLGHAIPEDALPSVFRFLQDHPWHSIPDPYAAGLPAGFPEYCSLGTPGGGHDGGHSGGAGGAGGLAGTGGQMNGGAGGASGSAGSDGGVGSGGTGAGSGPLSCSGLASNCGPSADQSCCASPMVTGGTFYRSYDAARFGYTSQAYPATVSDFRLDTYEITVGRFRKFVAAYSRNMIAAGAGKNPNNPTDPGWDTTWNASLPADAAALQSAAACNSTYQTWTSGAGANENRPMNCLSWYEAYAFCIWDGGRLPTEAEWNYAASGGAEQRVYPWSNPPASFDIDCSYANYYGGSGGTDYCVLPRPGSTNNVGSESPKGDGRYGQADLAGNVSEWTLDWYTSPYSPPCVNCAKTSPALTSRVMRGGGFGYDAWSVLSSFRGYFNPLAHYSLLGARCARSAP